MSQLDLELAEELLRKGRYSEAIERLRALLSDRPDDPEIRGRVAEAYRLAGNQERAFHHFNKAAAIFGRRDEVLGACRMLKAANSVSPNEPDILFRMAECLKMLGNQPELEQVLRSLVSVARASGDRRRAWALDELCGMYPDDLDLAIHHATVLGEAGRIEEAIDGWKRVSARLDQRGVDMAPLLKGAAELAKDRPNVGVDLADILMAHQKPRDALALLVPFYEKFPDEVRVLETLLRALEQLDARDKIVPARIELVKARTKLGQRAQAVTEITKLLKDAPSDPAALEVCAHACAAFGIMGEATRLWFQLARLYDAEHERTGRDRALFACLKANPNHEQALELGARVLRDAGRGDEASSLERRLYEVRQSRPDVSHDMPSAPIGDTDQEAAAALGEPAAHQMDETPMQWDTRSVALMLDDDDVLAETPFSEEDETVAPDGFTPSDLSSPSGEQMPIHQNPWTDGLDHEVVPRNVSGSTHVVPRNVTSHDEQIPTRPLPKKRSTTEPDGGPFFSGGLATEMALPPEDGSEETEMVEMGDSELRALREEFGSDDQPTWIELESQAALTPAGGTPLKAEEFESKRRRGPANEQLVTELFEEAKKK